MKDEDISTCMSIEFMGTTHTLPILGFLVRVVWESGNGGLLSQGVSSKESVVKKILEDVEISQVQDHSAPWIP